MKHKFDRCPRCGSRLVKATAINGGESTNWLQCTRCNTFVNTWLPMEHQDSVLRDDHVFIGNFGGYGTGKTTTDMQEVYKHIFITPKANVLIGANVISQYEQTIKRDMESDCPKAFIKSISTQKQQWDFINGARIMWRPLDDVDKVRSYNLTMFLILEASEVTPEAIIQLKTRLRNMNAAKLKLDKHGDVVTDDDGIPVVEAEWRKGIVESNPDSGWIRSEILFKSDVVEQHGNACATLDGAVGDKDPLISSHVADTSCNKYLPANFVEQISAGKPKFWVDRYIYSSFDYSEGLVHPGYAKCIVPFRELDYRRFKHIVAADYGLHDDFVYLFGLIDDVRGKLIIYKELVLQNKSVEELAMAYFKDGCNLIPEGGYYTTPLLDPKSGAKRDYDKKSLYDHFAEYNIAFQPGAADVNIRVYRTNTYIESGRVEIFETCSYLINELRDYKFNEQKLGEKYTKNMDKPQDGNDHAICCLQWMCCALPIDPRFLELGSYDRYGNLLGRKMIDNKTPEPWQLSDDDDEYGTAGMGMFDAGEW